MKSKRVKLVICDSNRYVIVSVACYTYTYSPLKAELIVHYDNLYTCLMSHSFYMTKPFAFLSFIILITMDQNSLYIAVFYTDNCFSKKSTFILHLHSNDYISTLVYSLNIRQYVIVLKRMRSQVS